MVLKIFLVRSLDKIFLLIRKSDNGLITNRARNPANDGAADNVLFCKY